MDGNAIPGYDCAPLDEAVEAIFNGFAREQYSSYVGAGYAMGAGEKKRMIDLKFKDGHMPDEDSIRDRIRRVDIVIDYENLYGETFEYSSYQELLMRDG